jgi:phenylpropionate dioxygenase-like ring-hydroxylating dioxygenase large terminal subunit
MHATASPRVDSMLGTLSASIAKGRLPLWIYNDAEVFRLEMERIFARNWVFVAHESEIPRKGDYVSRPIGQDPFIIVRGEDGKIRALFDSCRHRGARICPSDQGNAQTFFCPYHGWSYTTAGALEAVPAKTTAYQHLNLADWGLLQAPRVEIYRGLVFAALTEDVPALTDYLGDYRWYLDTHLALTEGGLEVVGTPHRWHIDADWKSGAENFSGDSYHTQTLHQSIMRIGLAPKAAAGASGGVNDIHVTECSGHATSIRRTDPGTSHFWGYPKDVAALFRQGELSAAQFELAQRSVVHTGTVFPNLSLIHIGGTDSADKPNSAYFSLRQWQPRAPGQLEAWSWVLVPKDASAEFKARSYKVAVANFSPSGNFEQDDSVTWSGVARSAQSVFARNSDMHLNYQMGLPEMSTARLMKDWPGPGAVYDTNLEEGVQRTFFNHWCRAMRAGARI